MGLHKSQDLYFPTIDGLVKRTGGTSRLAMGQLAVVNLDKGAGVDGASAVDNFDALSKRAKLELRLGSADLGVTRSLDNKPQISIPFTLNDIVSLEVDAPKVSGIGTDEFIIGFNGTDGTEIVLANGDNEVLQLSLIGTAMGYIGYHDKCATTQFQIQYPNTGTVTMQQLVTEAVEELNRAELIGQIKITDYVEITIVDSSLTALGGGTQFYNLTVSNDDGTFSNLARVQAQYPLLDVVQSSVGEDEVTYSTIAGALPAAYSVGLPDILKGCAACPAGYTILTDGFVYQITLEDEGDDQTLELEAAIPGAEAGSASRNASEDGVGYYSIVTDDALTQAEIDTFLSITQAVTLTGTSGTANVIIDGTSYLATFTTDLTTSADNFVTSHAVAILADENIVVTASAGVLTFTFNSLETPVITVANVSGDLDATIAAALTLFSTGTVELISENVVDLCTNATVVTTAWVVGEDCTVTTEGYSMVVADDECGAARLADLQAAFPDLTIAQGATVACQTTYTTNVNSNVVCDECDPIFSELFSSDAPGDFEQHSWVKDAPTWDAAAKMGIRFKSKLNILSGSENFRDDMDFVAESVKLSLVGGFPDTINESYNLGVDGRMVVTLLNRFEPSQNWGGDLRNFEDMGKMYFEGVSRHKGNNYGKYVFGEETRFKGTGQYVDYIFTIEPSRTQGGVTERVFEKRTYHVYAEVGRHQAVEQLLNDLVVAAGLPIVQAFANTA